MENSYWEDKLTSLDRELLLMVESLTEKDCELCMSKGGQEYFFLVDCEGRGKEWIGAVKDAIEGKAGERFVRFEDFPEIATFEVRIRFSKNKDSFKYGDEREKGEPDVSAGDVYCRQLEEIRAVQVKRTNLTQLQKFVGGGEMRIPKKRKGVASFHFLNGGAFLDVLEDDYICRGKVGFFKVEKEVFEKNYEAK